MAQKPTILIIDDNSANRRLIDTIFTRAGFRVFTAGDGPEGRTLAQTESPDLILLDVMMPGESGFDTCAALKGDGRTRDIPVIFLSASVSAQDRQRGLALGAVDYITKPFNLADMLTRAEMHLRQRDS
jgi:sigma-B regulation protein RsbU (phosphoserine phosphatase)